MSAEKVIELGTEAYARFTVRNASGVITDPVAITFAVLRAASGVVATYASNDARVTRESTGVYRLDYVPGAADVWYARGIATSPTVTKTEPFRVHSLP